MELIPILSTIILVATISTFILAVGAYILYKIRENRSQGVSERKHLQPAELVEPEEEIITSPPVKKIIEQEPDKKVRVAAKTVNNRQQVHIVYKQPESKVKNNGSDRVEMPVSKYIKYSSEGIKPVEEEKVDDFVKWR
jgi:flagellar basal body-associated protein FliL